MVVKKSSAARSKSKRRGPAAPSSPIDLAGSGSPTTLQYRVRNHLLEMIRSGRVTAGDRLPTEQELEDQFGVSRITVRNAVGLLVSMGLVFRRAGQGTFVTQPKIEQELARLTGFVEDMDAIGMRASARVLKITHVAAPSYVAARLRARPKSIVTYIERVRLGDDEPLTLDVSYLPLKIGKRIAQEDLVKNPFFSLMENVYGITLGHAEYVFEAAAASPTVARHLSIRSGSPVLLIERTTYARDGQPLIYEKLHYRGDRMRYRTRVTR